MAGPYRYAGIWSKGSAKALGAWLASSWPLWVFLSGLMIPVATLHLAGFSFKKALLHGGFSLQILSIILIVYELNRLRIYWGKPGFLTSITKKLAELGRIFLRKRKTVDLQGAPINIASHLSAPTVIAGEHQVVRMGNIRPGVLNLSVRPVFIEPDLAQSTSDFRISHRSILMTMTGTKGKRDYLYPVLAEGQGEDRDKLFLNQRLCMITSKHVLPEFLQLLFLDDRCKEFVFKRSTGTANQANIGMGTLEQWPLPIPPEPEQHRIVQTVDELMALCDQLKERLNQASETRLQLAETTVEQALSYGQSDACLG